MTEHSDEPTGGRGAPPSFQEAVAACVTASRTLEQLRAHLRLLDEVDDLVVRPHLLKSSPPRRELVLASHDPGGASTRLLTVEIDPTDRPILVSLQEADTSTPDHPAAEPA